MPSALPSPSPWPALPWLFPYIGHQALFIFRHFCVFTSPITLAKSFTQISSHHFPSLMSSDQNLDPADRHRHSPTVSALLSPHGFRSHPRIWNKNISTSDTGTNIFSLKTKQLELNQTLEGLYNRIGLLMNRQLESGGWSREGTMVGSRSTTTKSLLHCVLVYTLIQFSWNVTFCNAHCTSQLLSRENCDIPTISLWIFIMYRTLALHTKALNDIIKEQTARRSGGLGRRGCIKCCSQNTCKAETCNVMYWY